VGGEDALLVQGVPLISNNTDPDMWLTTSGNGSSRDLAYSSEYLNRCEQTEFEAA